MQLNEIVKNAHQNALFKGFWDEYTEMVKAGFQNQAIETRLMLIVGEAAEAEDALRHGKPMEDFAEELADIVIRVCDLAGGMDIDLESAVIEKMQKNLARPHKHGKRF